MNRRDFMSTTGSALASGILLQLPIAAGEPARRPLPSRLIPPDKGLTREALAALRERGTRRTYRGAQRYTIGMPCSGIGAGQLYILGDGTLGGWHIDGRLNPTGYGADAYQTRRAPRQLQQGFRIVIDGRGSKESFTLADRDFGGDYSDIDFIGEYPIAEVHYRRGNDLRDASLPPLDISLRVFSPFIPLNAPDSAIPGTYLSFTLRNKGEERITGSLEGWLENGVEPDEPGLPPAMRRNRVIHEEGLTAVIMDAVAEDVGGGGPDRPDRLLHDFEGEDYEGWSVEGAAFGQSPALGTQANQQKVSGFAGERLVNSYPGTDQPTGRMLNDTFTIDRRYLTFLIGGGGHAGRTCMNLIIDGAAARTATGKNNERLDAFAWDVREFEGREARLEIVDAATGPWGHINVDHIVHCDRLPEALGRPREDSLTNGSMALSFMGDALAAASTDPVQEFPGEPPAEHESIDHAPVGMISSAFDLVPGESIDLTFIVSWHFPNLHTGQKQWYTSRFGAALEVAQHLARNHEHLAGGTELVRRTMYEETTLPWWLALRLLMPAANLATGTAQWWKTDDELGRFWGWEGVGCCHGTCTHVWNYAQAEARLFPELARSTRIRQDLGSAFEEATGRVAFRGEVGGGFEFAADGQAGTILKCYREHLMSRDDSFLREHWPRIHKAMEFLIAKDVEQSPDDQPSGIITTRQHNTYDIDFVGANTFVGSLYLASLHAAAAMADLMDDADFAARCRAIAHSGREWTEANLFNGDYFIQKRATETDSRFQYDTGCLADQLFGQTWARMLDLPSVYDESMVKRALESIYRYNWAPAVGEYNAQFPPERVFARDREGGLFICTWPKGGRPNEPVRYRDEVWTGIEYQVATGMIYEGLIDEALVIVKAIDDRYDGARHNPWNEVECGDHYARALASWGVLLALSGFAYDGPRGLLGMSPRITPENFAGLFIAAESWGLLRQKREGNQSQEIEIEVRWGDGLRLREFTTRLPESATTAKVGCEAWLAGRSIPARCTMNNLRATAEFGMPTVVRAGEVLRLKWQWERVGEARPPQAREVCS